MVTDTAVLSGSICTYAEVDGRVVRVQGSIPADALRDVVRAAVARQRHEHRVSDRALVRRSLRAAAFRARLAARMAARP